MKTIYVLLDSNNCVSNVFYKKTEDEEIPQYDGIVEVQVDDDMFNELTSNSFGEYYLRGNTLEKVVKDKPSDELIKPIYNYELKKWVETATQDEIDLDAINKMYDEYKTMDFPSVVKEMELQDPAMSEEFLNMLIQLRGMASQITLGIRTMSLLPQPSKELIAFKNRFNQNK